MMAFLSTVLLMSIKPADDVLGLSGGGGYDTTGGFMYGAFCEKSTIYETSRINKVTIEFKGQKSWRERDFYYVTGTTLLNEIA